MLYAEALADLIPPKAMRLRRDFSHLLTGIKAHALLQREHRDIVGGVIQADIETDYAVVSDLMADVMTENLDIVVTLTIRETVEAVRKLEPVNALENWGRGCTNHQPFADSRRLKRQDSSLTWLAVTSRAAIVLPA